MVMRPLSHVHGMYSSYPKHLRHALWTSVSGVFLWVNKLNSLWPGQDSRTLKAGVHHLCWLTYLGEASGDRERVQEEGDVLDVVTSHAGQPCRQAQGVKNVAPEESKVKEAKKSKDLSG